MHRLFSYLEKIRLSKSINYPVFAELCRKEKVFGLDKIFKAEHEGAQRYRVEILDEIQFNELLLRFAESGGRVAAAKTGNSHRESVGASYLLRRSLPLWQPELVWLPADKTVPAAAGKTAVVLENLENFHHFDKMSALLRQWQPENAFATGFCCAKHGADDCANACNYGEPIERKHDANANSTPTPTPTPTQTQTQTIRLSTILA